MRRIEFFAGLALLALGCSEPEVKGPEPPEVDLISPDGTGIYYSDVLVTFEGMVEDMSVGDTGIVSIIGRGSIADDSATPTTFEVIGICP